MYERLQAELQASLLQSALFTEMCVAVLCRKESSSEELHYVLANLEGGVGLKATDYLGDCR